MVAGWRRPHVVVLRRAGARRRRAGHVAETHFVLQLRFEVVRRSRRPRWARRRRPGRLRRAVSLRQRDRPLPRLLLVRRELGVRHVVGRPIGILLRGHVVAGRRLGRRGAVALAGVLDVALGPRRVAALRVLLVGLVERHLLPGRARHHTRMALITVNVGRMGRRVLRRIAALRCHRRMAHSS